MSSSYNYGYNTPNNTPSGNKQTESEVISWVVIIAAFAVFWPIGLFLLIRKLSDSTQSSKQRNYTKGTVPAGWAAPGQQQAMPAKESLPRRMTKTPSMKKSTRLILKIVGAFLLFGGLMMAYDAVYNLMLYFNRFDLMELLQSCAIGGAGAFMFIKSILMDKASKRYMRYLATMRGVKSISFSQLSSTMGMPEQKIIDDLEHMIEKGYFGATAYLDYGLGYFFRSRTAAEEAAGKKRAEAATPKEAEEGYAGVLRSIRRANDRIADPVLSAKIDRLEEVTANIFRIIEKDEKKTAQVRTFLEYYLPTTQKLLDSYAEFEAAGVDGENLSQAKEKIEDTMDNIVQGFEHQLDALYAAEAMDIQSDINVMNNMMQRDSAMRGSDFRVSGSARRWGMPSEDDDDDDSDVAVAFMEEEE